MKFTITGCAPSAESVTAGLKIGLRVETSHFEALLGIRGLLLSPDNKIVTTLTTFTESNTPVNHPVAAHGSGDEAYYNNEISTNAETQLLGFLNRQAIDW